MFVLRSTFFQAPPHVYAYIYMPMCSLPCFYLDLHIHAQIYMPMLKSMCLSAPCHACVLRSICWLLCHVLLQPFCPLISLFVVFYPLLVGCRSRFCGLGLHPHAQAYTNGFGSSPYMSMFACLLASMLYVNACLSRSRLCHALFPPQACLCGRIHPSQGLIRCSHL